MGNIFSFEGPVYRFLDIVFDLLVINFLWLICSLPIVTIGPATTAAFYVTGKIIRDESAHLFRDFFKSFKNNFFQSLIVSFFIALGFWVTYINIRNISIFGKMGKFIYPFQIFIMIELTMLCIYIFPLISRYTMTVKNFFKAAFILAHAHLLTTIGCVLLIVANYFIIIKIPALIILFTFSLYAYASYYLLYNAFKKSIPEEKELVEKKQEELENLDRM